MVDFKPAQLTTVSPYFVVDEPRRVMDFTRDVFGAEEIDCVTLPDGTVMHSKMRIGDTVLMLGRSSPDMGEITGAVYVYVEDVDAAAARAVEAGAEVTDEVMDMFWGDRFCGVVACGVRWWIATHTEDLTSDEIQRRMLEHFDRG